MPFKASTAFALKNLAGYKGNKSALRDPVRAKSRLSVAAVLRGPRYDLACRRVDREKTRAQALTAADK